MSWGRTFIYALLALWSLVCIFPFYWVAITAFKSVDNIDGPPAYLPFVDYLPSLDAWRFILLDTNENLILRFVNSAVAGLISTVLALVIGGMAVYGVTRFWPSNGYRLMTLMLATRILPPALVVLPLYLMAQVTGMLDTLTALVLTYVAVNLPVAVWLLQPVLGLRASDQEEAAQIDGASHLTIFFTIVVPMARAGVAAAGLLIFLLCWNEYLFAAYLTSGHALTLPPWMVGQLSLKEAQIGGEAEEWAHLSAALLVMAFPVLIFVVFVQRHLGRSVAVRS